jgi:Ca-activated chloride channel homolog
MNFAMPHYFWGLLVFVPTLILFFWWSGRVRQKLATQFIRARLLPGLVAGVSATRQKVRAACLVVAVVSLLLALARPQWNYDLEEMRQRGLDIVMAVDTSKSMLATDVAPNRLARAKLAALDLMQQAKYDRLGLVAFSGTAFLQCPLTIDDAVFRQSVEALDTTTLPVGGTALAEAIETALKAFKEQDNYKVLVLFTDGEDHDSGALEAAQKAAKSGMRIFTIGIGSPEGEILQTRDAKGQTNYIRDENGNVVKSSLNEMLLQQIAHATPGGEYLPLRANTVDVLYQQHLAALPKTTSSDKWMKRPREQFHWPLAIAIVLLLVEMFVPERKPDTKPANAGATKTALATATMVVLLLLPLTVLGSTTSALREYRSGQYDQSLKDYEQLLQRRNNDPRLHFNAGTAAYRQGEFDRALKYFDGAVTSPDLIMQQQAYYNKGNALFRLGEQEQDPSKKIDRWQLSLTNYNNSLALKTNDADAKFNYDFVNRKLEELRKQQQQGSKGDQSKNDQNQQQKDQNNQSKSDQSKNDQSKNDQSKNDQSNDPSKNDQAKNDQSKNDQAKNDQSKNDQSKNDQPKNDQQPEKKDSQSKNQDQAKNSPEENPANYSPRQMTPQQAQQLLDAQKNDEMLLPAKPEGPKSGMRRPVKDW